MWSGTASTSSSPTCPANWPAPSTPSLASAVLGQSRPWLAAHDPRVMVGASFPGPPCDNWRMTDIPAVDLGRGVAMPMVGFGTWQLHGELAYEATRHALQAGYRHIDTATMYRNEEQVGRALADSRLDRAGVFITTKLPPGNAGRARVTIAESLKALGTDYVDLWLVHWPPRGRHLVPLWPAFTA